MIERLIDVLNQTKNEDFLWKNKKKKRRFFFWVEVGLLKPKHSASTAFTTLALANLHSVEILKKNSNQLEFYMKSELVDLKC